tara:strand:+ start:479 stop:796 length:318 start_codon:yes stop_codon:yes gene_type:complete
MEKLITEMDIEETEEKQEGDINLEDLLKVYRKFKRGHSIDNEIEAKIIFSNDYAGFFHHGFNYETEKAEAKLTQNGKWCLKQQMIIYKEWKRKNRAYLRDRIHSS